MPSYSFSFSLSSSPSYVYHPIIPFLLSLLAASNQFILRRLIFLLRKNTPRKWMSQIKMLVNKEQFYPFISYIHSFSSSSSCVSCVDELTNSCLSYRRIWADFWGISDLIRVLYKERYTFLSLVPYATSVGPFYCNFGQVVEILLWVISLNTPFNLGLNTTTCVFIILGICCCWGMILQMYVWRLWDECARRLKLLVLDNSLCIIWICITLVGHNNSTAQRKCDRDCHEFKLQRCLVPASSSSSWA